MKTAVSVPDEVFDEAEHLAKRLKISRSELYAKALAEFVSRHAPTLSLTRSTASAQNSKADRTPCSSGPHAKSLRTPSGDRSGRGLVGRPW